MTERGFLKMNIRKKMFHEMLDKSIFNQVKEYAFEYADGSLDRNVYPTQEAIEALKIFDEDLPDKPNRPFDILEQLHK
jgi:hypothetical protein